MNWAEISIVSFIIFILLARIAWISTPGSMRKRTERIARRRYEQQNEGK